MDQAAGAIGNFSATWRHWNGPSYLLRKPERYTGRPWKTNTWLVVKNNIVGKYDDLQV